MNKTETLNKTNYELVLSGLFENQKIILLEHSKYIEKDIIIEVKEKEIIFSIYNKKGVCTKYIPVPKNSDKLKNYLLILVDKLESKEYSIYSKNI